jgi:hypothetical protein
MDKELRLESRYIWVRIPLLSWVMLVFPLILPPIPLGPIEISISWNRFEEVALVKRARRYIEHPINPPGFPMGWLVNVIINIIDIATLGLRSAFMAAWLADRVNAKAINSEQGEKSPSNIAWLAKWLLLGNAVFIAVWIILPGRVLERFIRQIETRLYEAYNALPVKIEVSEGTKPAAIVAEPALSSETLVKASRHHLAVLGIYMMPLSPTEKTEDEAVLNDISTQMHTSAKQILQNNVSIFWCNLAENYPTHYQEVGKLLPAGTKYSGNWVAFQDGKVACTANSASEAIAKALGIAANVRAINNMVIGTTVTELDTVRNESHRRPVILFILGSTFTPTDWVKCYSAAFLKAVSQRKACLYYIKLDKKGSVGEELRRSDIQWTGCVIWSNGQPVERIKQGWLTDTNEIIAKAVTWLTSEKANTVSNAIDDAEHLYGPISCYIFGQWKQVVDASHKQPVVLASGSNISVQKAEAAFLRQVGTIFAERGFCLVIAPTESMTMEGTVASGLSDSGLKAEGCYIVQNGKVTNTISNKSLEGNEQNWLDGAIKHLAGVT